MKYTDDKYPTSILCFEKNKHVLKHPTEKTVSILEWLIKTYTDEDDTVLEPKSQIRRYRDGQNMV